MDCSYMLDDCMIDQMSAVSGSISPNGAWAAAACRSIATTTYPEVDMMLVLKALHKQAEDTNMVGVATYLQKAFNELYAEHANKRSER
jgi:hypothetical protein